MAYLSGSFTATHLHLRNFIWLLPRIHNPTLGSGLFLRAILHYGSLLADCSNTLFHEVLIQIESLKIAEVLLWKGKAYFWTVIDDHA